MIEYENLAQLNQSFFEEYSNKFDTIMKQGWYILGNEVKWFEQSFAHYCNTNHCIGVANWMDALTLALKSCDFAFWDEVIVPSNTYIATILSIIQNGLKPILVEPDITTYNLDPHKIEEKITKKTKAIMPVHLYGKLCDMESIMTIAKKYNCVVIEDCAQAHWASYKWKKAWSFWDFWAFSFYPTKNLWALWDAWAITCQSTENAEKIAMLRNYWSKVKYYNQVVWYNSRLDEIQAWFLSVKLPYLDLINNHKRNLAHLYMNWLRDDYIKPVLHNDYYDVYHIFAIRHPKRDQLKEYLLNNDIKTEIHYPVTPNKQQAMKWILDNQETPIAQEIHDSILSLPISYFHTWEDVLRVIEVMNKF
jgi:dTDP-4-amino-4,6-dideoxygalactose transaminase